MNREKPRTDHKKGEGPDYDDMLLPELARQKIEKEQKIEPSSNSFDLGLPELVKKGKLNQEEVKDIGDILRKDGQSSAEAHLNEILESKGETVLQ